jgi:succinate dehydrogenase / fumarate reductase membrane anchor subunit
MAATSETVRRVKVRPNYDHIAWKWMRYSALLLIPLVWFHVILQDVIVGVHAMDLNYVAGFAMAHGINGVRQVANDFIKGERARVVVSWLLFIFWLVITGIGAVALIAGVR